MFFSHPAAQKWLKPLFSFGAMHAATLLLPLLAFPWLGRKLGPQSFGLLMYMCVFPPIIMLLVEWGFPLGAARAAAMERGNREGLGRLLGNVVSAKILLGAACCIASLLAMPFLPHVSDHPVAYMLAISMGLGRAITPFWLYQGTGSNLARLSAWDTGSSLAALLLVFLFINGPADWPLYLLFSAVAKTASNTWLTCKMWLEHEAKLNFRAGLRLIKNMRTIFYGLFFTSAYHYISQLALGFFLAAPQMGIVVAFGKMLRALISLVNPFTQTIFPEICVMRKSSPQDARAMLRKSLGCTFLGAFFLVLVLWPLASFLVGTALGPEYSMWGNVFQTMLLATPFAAANHVLGLQALIPFGQEKTQSAIRGWATAASVPLAACLAGFYGIRGAAFLPLAVECGIFASFIAAILKLCPEAFFRTGRDN